MSLNKIAIAKYSMLPGIIPRVTDLFTSGFMHISYLMAVVYGALRLLPPDHPYLNPANRGLYTLRSVIAQASHNLKFSWKNIDQIIIFFTVLMGLGLIIFQVILLVIALIAQQPAFAQNFVGSTIIHGPSFSPHQDIAFTILDRVFGLVGIFDSCVSVVGVDCLNLQGDAITTPQSYPLAFHIAFRTLLEFYSLGIFFVAVIMIIYFVTAITAETAASGTAFGRRTNRLWAPIRLILFFALLTPLGGVNGGINSAQYITFTVAKYGSNFATGAWEHFNSNLANGELLQADKLIARSQTPEITNLVSFMYLARVCQNVEERAYGTDNIIQPWIVNPEYTPQSQLLMATDFAGAKDLANLGSIQISFGRQAVSAEEEKTYKKYLGGINPLCGQISIPLSDARSDLDIQELQKVYYTIVQNLWQDSLFKTSSNCLVDQHFASGQATNCTNIPDKAFQWATLSLYNSDLNSSTSGIPAAMDQIIAQTDFFLNTELLAKGWAGSALWYNRIAELNGVLATAAFNVPQIVKYPMVMETVKYQKLYTLENITPRDIFNPQLTSGKTINYVRGNSDANIANVLYYAHKYWSDESKDISSTHTSTGNAFIDTINLIFGTSGVFDMRANTDINPLAQLSALGRSIMEATVRNLGIGMAGEGMSLILGDQAPQMAKASSSFLYAIGMAMLSMSLVLYYVLPFLPFLYFLFAVSGWIKSIFEAIVAMPLWALAHIRIDGDGLPGNDASNGYFLLFEIFLRPILITFGMLASIVIFSALVNVLNVIFDLVIANTAGYAVQGQSSDIAEYLRGPVDEFFYTAMYVVICYMMALSCFKLIDLIPNTILRYMGQSVKGFQESDKDPAGGLTGITYKGTALLSGQIKGGALGAI
jgi:conjugal transfer/type IV secretion protein DotA/TraY